MRLKLTAVIIANTILTSKTITSGMLRSRARLPLRAARRRLCCGARRTITPGRPQPPQYKSIGNAALSEGQFFFLTNPVAADMTGAIQES
jgi:hypothetical protein